MTNLLNVLEQEPLLIIQMVMMLIQQICLTIFLLCKTQSSKSAKDIQSFLLNCNSSLEMLTPSLNQLLQEHLSNQSQTTTFQEQLTSSELQQEAQQTLPQSASEALALINKIIQETVKELTDNDSE